MSDAPFQVEVLADATAVARRAGEYVARRADEAVRQRGRFTIALSGGSTPRTLYELLASPAAAALGPALAWERLEVFWGDERYVPSDHPDSNYRMTREAMLGRVPIPHDHVHPIPTDLADPQDAAASYEQTLRRVFQLTEGGLPRFDLVLLGLGPDAHTASLFPGSAALQDQGRLVVANWIEKFHSFRITMTAPVLNHAACVLFLVSGSEKTVALREVWYGPRDPQHFPAQLIHPESGELVWLIDRAAQDGLPVPAEQQSTTKA